MRWALNLDVSFEIEEKEAEWINADDFVIKKLEDVGFKIIRILVSKGGGRYMAYYP